MAMQKRTRIITFMLKEFLSFFNKQPSNVSCFEPFNITFKKVRDAIMSRSNHMELNNIILVGWVD